MNTAQVNRIATRKTVQRAYDCMDAIFTSCGIRDLTEGIYDTPETSYDEAQRAQRCWLLDQIGCSAGSRLLDIGCGYGTLLAEAEQRGAAAIGITLSPKQAQWCRRRGLTARVMDYRDVPGGWHNQFDCVVANGSMEHFVQLADVSAGRQDDIYREFFAICHVLLDPSSKARKLATTVIHLNRVHPQSFDLLKPPSYWPRGSDEFHAAMLEHTLGGFYPMDGQLERCAVPHFALTQAVDGTEDYRRTSEEWLQMIRRSFLDPRRLAEMLCKLFPRMFISPGRVVLTLRLLMTESWQWQFRGQHPPTKLWRHIWQYA
ncbi:MAG: class I SAM-dependent methyltransferase [bacterium]